MLYSVNCVAPAGLPRIRCREGVHEIETPPTSDPLLGAEVAPADAGRPGGGTEESDHPRCLRVRFFVIPKRRYGSWQ